MKTLVFRKLILEVSSVGDFVSGLIQYQVSIDGVIQGRIMNTVSIGDVIDLNEVQSVIDNGIDKAKQVEGAS